MEARTDAKTVPPILVPLIGLCISLFVVNLYYAQPLVGVIASDLNIPKGLAGSVASASQFGYALGLFLIVPLFDIVTNRKLVTICAGMTIVGSAGIATANSPEAFLISALIVGMFSSGAQVLLPYLSHHLAPENKGKVIGSVMAGVLAAVMLARPFALFIADSLGWRAIYCLALVATLIILCLLVILMPDRVPDNAMPYRAALRSMPRLFWEHHQVRRRTAYQATLFSIFTMFWAAVPLMLAAEFGMSATGIALFAFAGIGGVLAAPVAGRIFDKHLDSVGTVGACLLLACACFGSIISVNALLLIPLAFIAIAIDASIQTSQTISKLVILNVAPDIRGRINAACMTIAYLSGAIGSLVGVLIYSSMGWLAVALVCGGLALLVALSIICTATE